MANVKYYETRIRRNGKVVHVVSPPKYVQDAIGATYQQFDTAEDAIRYAMEVAQGYDDYKRTGKVYEFLDQNSVESLIRHFYTTHAFTRLADASKSSYRLHLNKMLGMRLGSSPKRVGDMLTRNFTTVHVDSLYQQAVVEFSQQTANQIVKIACRAWSVGMSHGKVRANPWLRVGMSSTPPREVLWEPEQVDAFIAAADATDEVPIGTWAMLCYHLCQRPGDMLNLRERNVLGHGFRFTQQKTGTALEVDTTPDLVARLSLHPATGNPDAHVLINPHTGMPYRRSAANRAFARIRAAAGLPATLHLADLRRTGATEMAESGVTEDELRSVTGHKSRGILNTYVRPTKKMASSAMQKRFKPKGDPA